MFKKWFDWADSNVWKGFRDVVMMVVAIIVLLKGNHLLREQNEIAADQARNLESARQSIGYLRTEIKQLATSGAPVTEFKPIIDDGILGRHNITLADYESQIPQVQEWLTNPYSGYPALVDAIRRVLQDNKLVGNAVPLTIINAANLKMHGRGTDNPIISSAEIDDARLKDAIYAGWVQKNLGSLSGRKSFGDIVAPIR